MSTKTVITITCDRCKAVITRDESPYRLRWGPRGHNDHHGFIQYSDRDLCKSCTDDLVKFLAKEAAL